MVRAHAHARTVALHCTGRAHDAGNCERTDGGVLIHSHLSLPFFFSALFFSVVVDTPAQHEQRMAASAVAAALPRTAAETVKQLAARRATLIGLSDSATIDLMRAGSRFHRWSMRGVLAHSEVVTVFFSANAFWWCSPVGPKREIAGQSVPIAALTDVFLSVDRIDTRTHVRGQNCC